MIITIDHKNDDHNKEMYIYICIVLTQKNERNDNNNINDNNDINNSNDT